MARTIADRFYCTACIARQNVFGSVAEWSKALVLGTSLPGGAGSNPAAASYILAVNLLVQI